MAGTEPGVQLVDLRGEAEALADDGLPGDELFLDYCHLHWRGYAQMALAIERRMLELGLLPAGREPPELEQIAAEFGMQAIHQRDRVQSARWR